MWELPEADLGLLPADLDGLDGGFAVEDLMELRAPEDAETPSDALATSEWARRWPIEEVWKARKMA